MPINQESLIMIPVRLFYHNFVTNAHTLKNKLSKGNGWGKEIILWAFE